MRTLSYPSRRNYENKIETIIIYEACAILCTKWGMVIFKKKRIEGNWWNARQKWDYRDVMSPLESNLWYFKKDLRQLRKRQVMIWAKANRMDYYSQNSELLSNELMRVETDLECILETMLYWLWDGVMHAGDTYSWKPVMEVDYMATMKSQEPSTASMAFRLTQAEAD